MENKGRWLRRWKKSRAERGDEGEEEEKAKRIKEKIKKNEEK